MKALMSALTRRAILAGKDVTKPFVLDGIRYVPVSVPAPRKPTHK